MARMVFLLVLIALPAISLFIDSTKGDDHLTPAEVEALSAALTELIKSLDVCPAGEGGTVQCGLFPKLPSAVCLGVKTLCKTVSMLGC